VSAGENGALLELASCRQEDKISENPTNDCELVDWHHEVSRIGNDKSTVRLESNDVPSGIDHRRNGRFCSSNARTIKEASRGIASSEEQKDEYAGSRLSYCKRRR
jgi:hypothetical protein